MHRHLCTAVLLLVALLLFPISQVTAQEATPRRDGLWFLVGMGFGSAAIKCDGCANDYTGGVAGTLAIGGTLSEQLLVGVESDWWTELESDVWNSVGAIMAVGYLFPRRDMGLYLKAGVGVAGFHSTGFGADQDRLGFGLMGGVGYELPLNWSISLVPMASYHWGTMGSFGNFRHVTQEIFQVGVGVYLP